MRVLRLFYLFISILEKQKAPSIRLKKHQRSFYKNRPQRLNIQWKNKSIKER